MTRNWDKLLQVSKLLAEAGALMIKSNECHQQAIRCSQKGNRQGFESAYKAALEYSKECNKIHAKVKILQEGIAKDQKGTDVVEEPVPKKKPTLWQRIERFFDNF